MRQTQFWNLGNSVSQAKLASWDDDEVDLETVICPNDEMHQRAGKRLTDLSVRLPNGAVQDFVWTWYSECLIRDRVLELFRAQGLSGFEVRPVTVRFESDRIRKQPTLWELVPIGWAGMAPPSSGVRSIEFCPFCGHRTYSLPTNPAEVINPASWDGSDFFIVWPLPGFIFITDRVAEVIRDNKLTGAVLRRPWELDFSGETCSPGRLSYWMSETRAQQLGRDLGITEV